jgi:hypothetical protein
VRRFALSLALVLLLTGLVAGSAAAKLSPVEQTWVKPMITIYNAMAANLGVVVDEEKASDALIAGSGKNNDLLTYTLSVFVSCPSEVKTVGEPPSVRLQAFYTDMVAACAALAGGGTDAGHAIGAIGKGKGALARSDLVASTSELSKGSKLLAAAEKQLAIVGGKNIFEA